LALALLGSGCGDGDTSGTAAATGAPGSDAAAAADATAGGGATGGGTTADGAAAGDSATSDTMAAADGAASVADAGSNAPPLADTTAADSATPPKGPQAVTIAFSARDSAGEVKCGAAVLAGAGGQKAQLAEFRFYVHAVELLAGDDAEPVALDQDGLWQDGEVALLDFADGSGKCQPSSPETRASVQGKVKTVRAWDGVRFTLGVPEAKNHGDPTSAPAPLDRTAMFWNWLDGYKFMRLDLTSPSWSLHIGSTGCSGSPGQPTACTAPNRPVIEVRGLDPTQQPVVLDLVALLQGTEPGVSKTCMSKAGATGCAAPFAALGLGGAAQTAFRKP
jgi:uncharacterized repeat protein (TIGR04052 family)